VFVKFLFLISTFLTLSGALGVVAVKNIMHACVYLLVSLIGVAGLYVTLGADYVGAVQLLVYVGGVVILMLFAVMLTGGDKGDFFNKFGFEKVPAMGSKRTYIMGFLTLLVFTLSVGKVVFNVIDLKNVKAVPGYVSTVESLGHLLLTDHVLAFEASSVVLLGALIGAAIIARPNRS
jgi:NADH-quinone oxidoreductase subunit J